MERSGSAAKGREWKRNRIDPTCNGIAANIAEKQRKRRERQSRATEQISYDTISNGKAWTRTAPKRNRMDRRRKAQQRKRIDMIGIEQDRDGKEKRRSERQRNGTESLRQDPKRNRNA